MQKQVIVAIAARAAHEANRAYCESIGDHSQVPWDDAPDWQKESAMAGADGVLTRRICAPMDSHQSWLDHKSSDGWVYGETKDPDKKTHPCMVPFHELPESQQQKDSLFFEVVYAVVTAAKGPGWAAHVDSMATEQG